MIWMIGLLGCNGGGGGGGGGGGCQLPPEPEDLEPDLLGGDFSLEDGADGVAPAGLQAEHLWPSVLLGRLALLVDCVALRFKLGQLGLARAQLRLELRIVHEPRVLAEPIQQVEVHCARGQVVRCHHCCFRVVVVVVVAAAAAIIVVTVG